MVDPFHEMLFDIQKVSFEHSEHSRPNYYYEEKVCSFDVPRISMTTLAMGWLGKHMVSWGKRLQDRYDVEAPQPSLTYSRR